MQDSTALRLHPFGQKKGSKGITWARSKENVFFWYFLLYVPLVITMGYHGISRRLSGNLTGSIVPTVQIAASQQTHHSWSTTTNLGKQVDCHFLSK